MTGQQLKNSILQMAVQGKLVPQDPNDEPASVLIERIRKEKEQLIKEGKLKKEKNPSYIFKGADNLPYEKVDKNEPVCIADEVPFDIPETWEWARISTIFTLQAGKNIQASDISESYFDGSYLCYGGNGVRGYAKTYNREGAYPIIGRQGALCGNIKYAKGKFYATEHAVCVETFAQTNVEWACAFLEALNLNQYATATAQPGLAVVNINNILIPIPPKNEQQRIIDVLIALQPSIKSYTRKECELNVLNEQFSDLLKKSILQEAVQGKLVLQDENDEPASVLLERIRAEKQKLIAEGKIKKDKHESVIFRRDNSHYEKLDGIERCIDDEIPFEIPESWQWVRLKNVTIKEIKRGKSPKYADSGSVYVFAQKCNVKLGGIDVSLAKLLDMKTFEKYPIEEYMVDEDIIINSTGNGTLGRIGMFHNTDRINDFVIVPDSHVTIIRASAQLKKDYLFFVLKYYQPYLEKLGEGSTNQTELRPSTIADLFVPIPPLQEQERIVKQISSTLSKIKHF